ncbi:MAG: isopentenyl-diphosphate Delta-isomerase [Sporichthyaceae bacterium]|nr:isopentenyl-diphosphate Delta-isomerase [Sporichthyaceae bacterium]
MPQPELVVLLAQDGSPIGTADKATVHAGRTPLHLAFSCYAFNPADQLLVTRRALGKRTFPGVWTNTCCGHPRPDEPVADAVRRRLSYELRLVPHALTLALPDFRYRASMAGIEENEVCPVYLCRVAAEPAPQPRPGEVAEVFWQSWPDYLAEADRPDAAHSPWTRAQVRELARHGAVERFLADSR